MWLVVVVLSEVVYVVEFRVVALEGLEESFDLALRRRFSSGTEDMLYSVFLAEACESSWAVVAPVLGSMI